MSEHQFYDVLLIAMFALAAFVFVALFFIIAPYGRHSRRGWGPQLNGRLWWVIMEAPAVIVFAVIFALGDRSMGAIPIIFLILWQIHYINRAFIFPLRTRGGKRQMTVLVVTAGAMFNALNAYLNARYTGSFGPGYASEWMTDPRFIIGVLLFVTGFAINLHSDGVLRRLREPNETGYKIPHGGFYKHVSSANYFGEITEWCGWALATWSLPGLAFAVWTAANLVPRARANHRWYLSQFPDYPRRRKALIPFLL